MLLHCKRRGSTSAIAGFLEFLSFDRSFLISNKFVQTYANDIELFAIFLITYKSIVGHASANRITQASLCLNKIVEFSHLYFSVQSERDF